MSFGLLAVGHQEGVCSRVEYTSACEVVDVGEGWVRNNNRLSRIGCVHVNPEKVVLCPKRRLKYPSKN